MSTNKSQTLKLHLWEPEDNFLRAEFNENFAAIDTAVKADRDAIKAEETARKSAVSAEASARKSAVSQLQSAISSAGNSSSTAVAELTEQLNAVRATANAAWRQDNRPYAMGTLTYNRGTAQSVSLGFRPSFVILFGKEAAAVIWGLDKVSSSSDEAYATAWNSSGFTFLIASGNAGGEWGSRGGYLAWK